MCLYSLSEEKERKAALHYIYLYFLADVKWLQNPSFEDKITRKCVLFSGESAVSDFSLFLVCLHKEAFSTGLLSLPAWCCCREKPV